MLMVPCIHIRNTKRKVELRGGANEGPSLGHLEITGRHLGTEIELLGYKPREPTSF